MQVHDTLVYHKFIFKESLIGYEVLFCREFNVAISSEYPCSLRMLDKEKEFQRLRITYVSSPCDICPNLVSAF